MLLEVAEVTQERFSLSSWACLQEALEGSEDLEVAHEEVSEAEVVVHPELDPQMPQEEPLSEQPGEYAFCQPLWTRSNEL